MTPYQEAVARHHVRVARHRVELATITAEVHGTPFCRIEDRPETSEVEKLRDKITEEHQSGFDSVE